jgi:L-lactate dehydrogenase
MIQAGTAREIVLVDADRRRAEGEMMDLQHCLPFSSHGTLRVADVAEVTDCQMVIVAAGPPQKPGQSRLDLVQASTEMFHKLFPMLSRNNPNALFLIVTNPVDVMTRVALKLSGLPPQQIVGSGTVLDTARFRHLISEHCRILPRHVHAYVIGEHGDSEVTVWSRAVVGSFNLAEYCRLRNLPFDDAVRDGIATQVRTAAYQIIERKGATHFAIGLATVRLAQAFALNQDSLFTVSRCCDGVYGLRDVCLSVPTLVSRPGAHQQIELELSTDELSALHRSAEILDETYQNLRMD